MVAASMGVILDSGIHTAAALRAEGPLYPSLGQRPRYRRQTIPEG